MEKQEIKVTVIGMVIFSTIIAILVTSAIISDNRPIVSRETINKTPVGYNNSIKYLKKDTNGKDKHQYKYILKGSLYYNFDYKKYLNKHPKDFVYVSTSPGDPPDQVMWIFTDKKYIDTAFLRLKEGK